MDDELVIIRMYCIRYNFGNQIWIQELTISDACG